MAANHTAVKNRFIEIVNNNELFMNDELEILEHLFKKYNFKTLSDYAKDQKITYPGAKRRLEERRIMSINLGTITFVA
jgi:hypothetical protein